MPFGLVDGRKAGPSRRDRRAAPRPGRGGRRLRRRRKGRRMSPAHVFEPTYEAIKRRLMTGEWATGARIEAARLADDLGVSMTPVRDSLYRLNGERMVDFTPGEGFHV